MCSGIGREKEGCVSLLSTTAWSQMWGGLSLVAGTAGPQYLWTALQGHSVEAPHLSRSGDRTHLTIFRIISPLWPFPALRFVFTAICAESLKLQSTLSADNEIKEN